MEAIIKKAIEGGYGDIKKSLITRIDCESAHQDGFIYIHYFEKESETLKVNIGMVFLDHLFWQALEKACQWGRLRCTNCKEFAKPVRKNKDDPEYWHDCCNRKHLDYGKSGIGNATDFYKLNLTEGWDQAIQYLNDRMN